MADARAAPSSGAGVAVTGDVELFGHDDFYAAWMQLSRACASASATRRPRLCAIGAGRNNSIGHAEALAALYMARSRFQRHTLRITRGTGANVAVVSVEPADADADAANADADADAAGALSAEAIVDAHLVDDATFLHGAHPRCIEIRAATADVVFHCQTLLLALAVLTRTVYAVPLLCAVLCAAGIAAPHECGRAALEPAWAMLMLLAVRCAALHTAASLVSAAHQVWARRRPISDALARSTRDELIKSWIDVLKSVCDRCTPTDAAATVTTATVNGT